MKNFTMRYGKFCAGLFAIAASMMIWFDLNKPGSISALLALGMIIGSEWAKSHKQISE